MTNSTQTNGTSNQESLTIAKYITKKTGLSFNDIIKQIKRGSLKLELNVETFESLTSVLTKPVSNLVNFTYIGEVYAYISNKTSEVSPCCGNSTSNNGTGSGSGSTGNGGTGSNSSTSPIKFTEILNNDLQYVIHASDHSLVEMEVDKKSYVVANNKKIESRLALSRISFYDANSKSTVAYPDDPSKGIHSRGMINLVSETDNHLEIDVLINRNASHSENRTIQIEFGSLAIQDYTRANPNKYFNYLEYDISAFSALTIDPEGFFVQDTNIEPFIKKVSNNQLGNYGFPLLSITPIFNLSDAQRTVVLPIDINWVYQQVDSIPSSLVGKKTSLSLKVGTKTTKINFKIVDGGYAIDNPTPPVETPSIALSYQTTTLLTQFMDSLYVEPKNLDTTNEFSLRPGLYFYNTASIKNALHNNSNGAIDKLNRLTFYFNCPMEGYASGDAEHSIFSIQDILNRTLGDLDSIAMVSHAASNKQYAGESAVYKIELTNVNLTNVERIFTIMNWSSSNAKPNILGVEIDVQTNVYEKNLQSYTNDTPVLGYTLNSTIATLFDNIRVQYDSDATDKSYVDGVEANKYDILIKPERLYMFTTGLNYGWDMTAGIAITGDSELDNYRKGADFLVSFSNSFDEAVVETKYSNDTTRPKDVQYWVSDSISRPYADYNAEEVVLISMLDRTDLRVDTKHLSLSVYVCGILFEKHIDPSMVKLKPTFDNTVKPVYQRFVDSLELQALNFSNDRLMTDIVVSRESFDELYNLTQHPNLVKVPLEYLVDDIELILNKGIITEDDNYTKANLFTNKNGLYYATKSYITDNTGYQIPGLENQTDSILITNAQLHAKWDSFTGSIGYLQNMRYPDLRIHGVVLTIKGNKFFKALDHSLADYDITPHGYLREAFKGLLSQSSLNYIGEATHLDKDGNQLNCHDYALTVNDPSLLTNFVEFLRSNKSDITTVQLTVYNAPSIINNPNNALFVKDDLSSSDIGGNYLRQANASYFTERNRFYYLDKPLGFNVNNLPPTPVTSIMYSTSNGYTNAPLDLTNVPYLSNVILKLSSTEKFNSDTKFLSLHIGTTSLSATAMSGANIPLIENLE